MKEKILNILRSYRNIFYSLFSIIALFLFFRWGGIKAFVGIMLGFVIMAYVFLSKNVIVRALIDRFEGNEYIDVISKKKGGGESG